MTHYSSRLAWQLHTNRVTQLLEAQRAAGMTLLDLTESNPTRAEFEYPAAALQREFQQAGWQAYEPEPAGLLRAREAVAAYYQARGITVRPERILLTASTSEAYSYLFKLLADPGDEVLVPRPSYPLFEFLAALESVKPAHYSLLYHGDWRLDFDSLARALTPRTRAVVIVNPNNPTGSFLKQEERPALLNLCRDHGLALISDEVFSDYLIGAPAGPALVGTAAAGEADDAGVLTFSLSGLSKVAGLPQMKVGWMVLSGPRQQCAEARGRLELIADTYLSVSSPVQHALPGLLALGGPVQEQIRARIRLNLAHMREAIPPGSPARLLHVEGGWYATLEVPRTLSEEQWVLELLAQDHVLVQPGYFYDFEREAYLILSLLTPRERFSRGLERILARIGKAS